MIGIWLVFFFVLGAAIGSFLNVVADRMPSGGSIISPSSHCPVCQRHIARRYMIPVFSYLWLRGHCRYCGSAIPGRVLWVELGTALLFTFLVWYYGISWELGITAFFCCLFIVLIVIDLEHGILPNKIVYPGIVIALIIAIAGSILGFEPEGVTDLWGFRLWIVDAVIGCGTGFIFFFIVALIFPGGMGWGDVKLAGLIGMVVGFPLVLVAIFLAIFSGGLIAAILLLAKVKQRKETIPFGPFLALMAMVTLFWGGSILQWYLGLM